MVGAGVDSIWVPELPAQVAVFLMLRVTGADYEFEEEQRLEVRLVAPDAEESTVLGLTFSIAEHSPLRLPGMDRPCCFRL